MLLAFHYIGHRALQVSSIILCSVTHVMESTITPHIGEIHIYTVPLAFYYIGHEFVQTGNKKAEDMVVLGTMFAFYNKYMDNYFQAQMVTGERNKSGCGLRAYRTGSGGKYFFMFYLHTSLFRLALSFYDFFDCLGSFYGALLRSNISNLKISTCFGLVKCYYLPTRPI